MHVFIANYVTLWFQLEIKKLVDNLQLKYAHLRILQVSQPVIERKQVFHTLVCVSHLSYQHDNIDHTTNGMEEYLHRRCFLLVNLDMTSNEYN